MKPRTLLSRVTLVPSCMPTTETSDSRNGVSVSLATVSEDKVTVQCEEDQEVYERFQSPSSGCADFDPLEVGDIFGLLESSDATIMHSRKFSGKAMPTSTSDYCFHNLVNEESSAPV